jgi:hypothetical protein
MKKVGLICSLAILMFSLSCGHPRALVSMTVTPSSGEVVGFGAIIPVQFKAYGTFIHPAETLDISQQVEWTSSVPQVANVENGTNGGRVTPAGVACGGTLITATAGKDLVGGNGGSSSIMAATATFTVTDPNISGCH